MAWTRAGQASEVNQPELREPLAHSGGTLGCHRTLIENGCFIIFSFSPPPLEGGGEAEKMVTVVVLGNY